MNYRDGRYVVRTFENDEDEEGVVIHRSNSHAKSIAVYELYKSEKYRVQWLDEENL